MAEKMPASATNPKLPRLTLTGGVRATGRYALAGAQGATALGGAELAAETAGGAPAVAAAVEPGAPTGLLAGVAGAPAPQAASTSANAAPPITRMRSPRRVITFPVYCLLLGESAPCYHRMLAAVKIRNS